MTAALSEKEILDLWSDDDFTQVDKDHNKVCEMGDGTVGKATGILNDGEEKEYKENHEDGKDEKGETDWNWLPL